MKINKFIYEDIQLSGSAFGRLNSMSSNSEYQKALNKASELYDIHKFSLVYFDMILSLIEYVNNTTNDSDFRYLILNDIDLTSLDVKNEQIEQEQKETEKELIEKVIPEIKQQDVNDTDRFVISVISENSVEDFEDLSKITGKEIFDSFEQVLKNEDLLKSFYQYNIINFIEFLS